ncbi:MAG: hypothetical protein M3405_17460 [Acidobacteriota bacterium]|nr:hypothetical protein [Acidobacteriota bacterium]
MKYQAFNLAFLLVCVYRTFPPVRPYERGKREPNLIDLLNYARIAKVAVEEITDDELELPFSDKK